MKIIWNINPLATVIQLDEQKDFDKLKWWIKHDNPDYTEEEIQKNIEMYVEALQDIHCGDCTYISGSCMKCQAEDYLDICTTAGMDKNVMSNIAYAFKHSQDIYSFLENFNPIRNQDWERIDPTGEKWNSILPKWKEGAKHALLILQSYHKEHNFK